VFVDAQLAKSEDSIKFYHAGMTNQKIIGIYMITQVKDYLLNLQTTLCHMFEQEDNTQYFQEDIWQHSNGGGGKTRVLEQGKIIEKAGVNFSHILGSQLPPAATLKRSELLGRQFQALGVSVVVHPRNPYVPTAHMNMRFFIAEKAGEAPVWWFGGGYDLTPYYGFEADCIHWHQTAKAACDPFGAELYPLFKQQCDDYFYLPHRQEPRGIGGLFFDDFNAGGFDNAFAFLQAVGNSFSLAYQPILTKRKTMAYTEREKNFQQYRRGRYVEFNLVYDRGTLFGLQTHGRTESILMSLPPIASWQYDYHANTDTPEAELSEKFLMAKDWLV